MRGILRWASLLVVLGVVGPAPAADDKKDTDKKPADEKKDTDKKPAAKEKPEPKDKMVPAGTIEGKLVRVEAAQKTLAVQISIPYLSGRNLAYLHKDIELLAADDMQVLMAQPPIEVDEKGNPKKLTAKDLKKAVKGPGNIKGFLGDFDSLRPDQIVIVFLKQKKEARKPPPRGKKEDKDLLDESKPVIGTVFIRYEPRK